ncbi:hypothetical protein CDAR_548461 [Caerostris darwini]|uniref:Uncharacterized protein n=1 Tax=Caerostris darwini TaxID=1538125 RepID=A0AAV4WKE1_9ARAC|nr:hypothetical protein CDAR_548461 [Caerostris darwini]
MLMAGAFAGRCGDESASEGKLNLSGSQVEWRKVRRWNRDRNQSGHTSGSGKTGTAGHRHLPADLAFHRGREARADLPSSSGAERASAATARRRLTRADLIHFRSRRRQWTSPNRTADRRIMGRTYDTRTQPSRGSNSTLRGVGGRGGNLG